MSSDSSSASRRPPDVVPRPLDGFIEAASRAGGIGVIQLDAFTTLVVRTAHSVYRITILKPYARELGKLGFVCLECSINCEFFQS